MPDRSTDMGAVPALLRRLDLPATVLSLLLAHSRAVEAEGNRLGLISAGDLGSVFARHTADSLLFALVRAPRPRERWVDVGSGAGFPGLVLACCYPGSGFVLVEPQRKRAGFLDLQCARLGLGNASVAVARAHSLEPEFDVAVARALAEPGTALQMLRGLSPGGIQILAVGDAAAPPGDADDVVVDRVGADSPGRFFVSPGGRWS